MGTCIQVPKWSKVSSEKGQDHGSHQMSLVLRSAETRAEASPPRPALLHPHAGRRHREQGAQVPSSGHRHGGKPEADRPVLTEGCPGREPDQRLISFSLSSLLKESGPNWHCPGSRVQRPRGLGWVTPPAPACASL